MPQPPSPASIAALKEFIDEKAPGVPVRGPVAPSGKVWDTRIAQAGTPEAYVYILEGWEICSADAMPSAERLDQLLHFRKLVPVEVILQRAKKVLDRLAPEEVPRAQEG